ncbi:MAG: hypothetical protein PHE89_02155 [Alphaproteobacteria bacterium]|nr:hypothetical protein [Alphaproteobacteria bacterium]
METSETETIVVNFPNRQICGVEYSEEIDTYIVIRRRGKVEYEVLDKTNGELKLKLTEHIHFSNRQEFLEKIRTIH